jgi:predicted RNA polymerase sigma factor
VAADAASTVADVHRAEWGRIVAALIAMTGDVDLAEDAAQEAFAVALEEWTARGVPDHPRAWLIRDAGIPYQVPAAAEMPERLDAVLTVIYLVFNEGYAATRGTPLVRADLCAEAIRLGRLVVATLGPDDASEASALVALMLLHDARRDTRQDHAGDLILLEDQDRGRWNHAQIRRRSRWSRTRCAAALVPSRYRPPLPHCTFRPQPRRPLTGGRSLRSTTCCCGSIRRRSCG